MIITWSLLLSLLLSLSLSSENINNNAEPIAPPSEYFEGVLSYDLVIGDRMWKVKQLMQGRNCVTEVYLGETRFQRLMRIDGQLYQIDDLSKRILVVPQRGMQPPHHGNREHPPISNSGPEHPPIDPEIAVDPNQGFHQRHHEKDPVELPNANISGGTLLGTESTVFEYKSKHRKTVLEGIPGLGLNGLQILQMFDSFGGASHVVRTFLITHQLGLGKLSLTAYKKLEAVELQLTEIQEGSVSNEVFELPQDYVMKTGVSRSSGGPGGGRSGRKGPPPGGNPGGRGGMR